MFSQCKNIRIVHHAAAKAAKNVAMQKFSGSIRCGDGIDLRKRCIRMTVSHSGARQGAVAMAKSQEPVTIKKYANRRLYNTGTSTYVTLEDLASMVKGGEDFVVYDAKTSEDITRSVLTQIIFEQENKGQNLLPITFLRQLIRFYGDSMQMLVPRYLEMSFDTFTRDQEKFRKQMTSAFGTTAFGPFDEQVRRNMELFERAFSVFSPFTKRGEGNGKEPATADASAQREPGDIDDMKRQLAEMQKKIDRLTSERS
jgi:polyhydroxyalkanoate synthesis repressor PhaR